ncbi:hypothetical protein [Ligilactobacillus pabuli]
MGGDVSKDGSEILTQWAKKHYSKKRTHIVSISKRTDKNGKKDKGL